VLGLMCLLAGKGLVERAARILRRFFAGQASDVADFLGQEVQNIITAQNTHESTIASDDWEPTIGPAPHESQSFFNRHFLSQDLPQRSHDVANECFVGITAFRNHSNNQVSIV